MQCLHGWGLGQSIPSSSGTSTSRAAKARHLPVRWPMNWSWGSARACVTSVPFAARWNNLWLGGLVLWCLGRAPEKSISDLQCYHGFNFHYSAKSAGLLLGAGRVAMSCWNDLLKAWDLLLLVTQWWRYLSISFWMHNFKSAVLKSLFSKTRREKRRLWLVQCYPWSESPADIPVQRHC